MPRQKNRDPLSAFTLIDLLVVLAILGVMLGLLLPAVQRAREVASRLKCQNNLRQLTLALHLYNDTCGALPPGHISPKKPNRMPYSGWTLPLLPYLEQSELFQRSQAAYLSDVDPFHNPPHIGLNTPLSVLACPSDPRVPGPRFSQRSQEFVAFTSYLGVSGKDYSNHDGVLFQDSRVRFADITDGLSNTLLLGERPPSADLQFGWWYAGIGQKGTGSADIVLGVRERNLLPISAGSPCGPGAYPFSPGRFNDPCSMFHFWSPHPVGANFSFGDGSIHFVSYGANPLMPALASRSGGDMAVLPD